MQFSLHRIPATGATAKRIEERRQKRRSEIDLAHQHLCEDVLRGRVALRDIDRNRVDLVRLQDDIAQVGQGRIGERGDERLGHADVGVILIRKLWRREIEALRQGRPIKAWQRDQSIRPSAWGIAGSLPHDGDSSGARATLVDVRPHVEIDIQLGALSGRLR
jgi:hypothetical protein